MGHGTLTAKLLSSKACQTSIASLLVQCSSEMPELQASVVPAAFGPLGPGPNFQCWCACYQRACGSNAHLLIPLYYQQGGRAPNCLAPSPPPPALIFSWGTCVSTLSNPSPPVLRPVLPSMAASPLGVSPTATGSHLPLIASYSSDHLSSSASTLPPQPYTNLHGSLAPFPPALLRSTYLLYPSSPPLFSLSISLAAVSFCPQFCASPSLQLSVGPPPFLTW